MEILEDRVAWEATFRAGWLAHYERTGATDFKHYNRPRNSAAPVGRGLDLSRSRLVLISAAGGYLPAIQPSFDAANLLGDYTIRLIPTGTPLSDITYACSGLRGGIWLAVFLHAGLSGPGFVALALGLGLGLAP